MQITIETDGKKVSVAELSAAMRTVGLTLFYGSRGVLIARPSQDITRPSGDRKVHCRQSRVIESGNQLEAAQ